MSSRTIFKRLATRTRLFIPAALVAIQPVISVLALMPQPAHADVASGDILYSQLHGGSYTIQRLSGTSTTNLSTSSTGDDCHPDVSQDGSRVTFIGTRPLSDSPSNTNQVMMMMNSDGSGQTELHVPTIAHQYADDSPAWAPNGQQIAYGHTNLGSDGLHEIYTFNVGTAADTPLTTGGYEWDAAWSPNGEQIVYDVVDPATGGYQLYIMNADGSNPQLVSGSNSGYSDYYPTWAPNGQRIYFVSSQGDGIWYYDLTYGSSNFTSSNVARHQLTTSVFPGNCSGGGRPIGVSADSGTITYSAHDSSNVLQIWTIPASCTSTSTAGSCNPAPKTSSTDGSNSTPTFVHNAWPPTYCDTATICINAPSPSDATYTRQVTIGLSNSGVTRYEYGWSTSDSTAPNTSYLQYSTDLTNKTGTVNYLGVYSGSGTTWNGGTLPNSDYYLWVRSVQTNGTPNAWNGSTTVKPLKVHTPKRPVWVGVGDSYSSGHHQDGDERYCPTTEDAPVYYAPGETLCIINGAPHLYPNDLNYSWVTRTVNNLNTTLNTPSDWTFAEDLEAASGASTYAFGVSGTTPGTDDWASGTAQSAAVRSDLYARYDSWNIVSMTGGADDTNWTDKLTDFYKANFFNVNNPGPWAMTTSNPSADCPDSQSVWNWLHAAQLDGNTDDQHIQANLQGVVTVATRYSPGVRVLNVGYPYVVDHTNSCSADSGTWHGSKSVIDDLNADHQAVTGTNVTYINLTDSNGFGADPVSGGYLQLRRLYGYPHAADTGQLKMASLGLSGLTGAGWNSTGTDFVSNGSFESGNASGWHDGTANATPSVSTAQAHSGNNSMTFTGSFDVTDSPNGISTQSVDTVRADFWVKGPAGKTIQPYFRQYLTDGNNTMYQSFTLSGGWDHIVTNALHLRGPGASDYDATKPGVDFNINDPSAGSGDSFYLDDVHEYGYVAAETCGFQNLMSSLNGDAVENCGGEAPYGTQYWNAGTSNTTLTTDTADAHDGAYSFKLLATAAGTITLNDSPNARDSNNSVHEVPSTDTSCTATAWMKGPNLTGRTLKLQLREYNGGTYEGYNVATAAPNGTWQHLSVTYTLNSAHSNNNSTLDLNAFMTGAQTGDVVRVDHITSTCQ